MVLSDWSLSRKSSSLGHRAWELGGQVELTCPACRQGELWATWAAGRDKAACCVATQVPSLSGLLWKPGPCAQQVPAADEWALGLQPSTIGQGVCVPGHLGVINPTEPWDLALSRDQAGCG